MKLETFCREISLNQEAIRLVMELEYGISRETFDRTKNLFYKDKEGFFAEIKSRKNYRQMFLFYYCKMACETYERYREKGIGDDIFRDTFSDISLWCEECGEKCGEYGLQEYRWLWRHIEMTIFRLGRLQFEKMDSEWEFRYKGRQIRKGDEVISIHIPKGERLKKEDCIHSFEQGRNFWGKDYPYICHSWLLFPGLKEVLGPDSNILQFQQLFEILQVDYEYREGEERIFRELKDSPEEYDESTSLRRNAKEYLCKGGRLGSGFGVWRMPCG